MAMRLCGRRPATARPTAPLRPPHSRRLVRLPRTPEPSCPNRAASGVGRRRHRINDRCPPLPVDKRVGLMAAWQWPSDQSVVHSMQNSCSAAVPCGYPWQRPAEACTLCVHGVCSAVHSMSLHVTLSARTAAEREQTRPSSTAWTDTDPGCKKNTYPSKQPPQSQYAGDQ